MSILKFIFSKKQDNNLTLDDINNIKSLIAHLDAVVNFLCNKNKLNDKLVSKFKSDKMTLLRILKINGLAIYFKRHITTTEIKSLLSIIKLSNEITRNHTRWIK